MGKLTKKDFKTIADIIKRNISLEEPKYKHISPYDFHYFMRDLCNYLATTNTQFKRDEFLKACGVEE